MYNLKSLQRMYEFISAFTNHNFLQFLQFSLIITSKEPKLLSVSEFLKLFRCPKSIRIWHILASVRSHMLIRN